MAELRLKMTVHSVKKVTDGDGGIRSEELSLSAVYGKEGTANSQWSKYTPAAQLTIQIDNPQAFDKLHPGQFVFVDLTITDRDS